jgi:hypothetical protein
MPRSTRHTPPTRPNLEHLEAREVPAITALFPTPGGDPALIASVQVVSNLTETPDGTSITFTVRDVRTDNSPVTVNLMAYTRDPANSSPPGDIRLQRLYSLDTKVLSSPDQIATLSVALPPCSLYQADVALGPLSDAVLQSQVFPDTVLQAAFGVNECPPPVAGFAPRTQGYWKNHAEAWPVDSLALGSVTYTRDQLLQILRTPVRGNGAIALAHQLIAAKLNVRSGAAASADVLDAIARADALLGSRNLLAGGFLPTSQTSSLVGTLDGFNNSGGG